MSKINLTTYLKKAEAKYIIAREEWAKLQNELNREETRYNSIEWINYTPQGKTAENNKHEAIKKDIIGRLEKLRTDFAESIKSVKEDSDKVFDKLFKYTAGDVDLKGVAIIQNGALNYKELIDLAETYRKGGNMTMYFMVSEKLKQDKPFTQMSKLEQDAYSYYQTAKRMRESRPDHELLDGFTELCLKGLRDTDYLSNGIHNHHEELFKNYVTEAEKINVDMMSPWE